MRLWDASDGPRLPPLAYTESLQGQREPGSLPQKVPGHTAYVCHSWIVRQRVKDAAKVGTGARCLSHIHTDGFCGVQQTRPEA